MSELTNLPKPPSKKKRFGSVPKPDDASSTLSAPETAPAAEVPIPDQAPAAPTRKARGKTERTIQFGTRVSAAFDREFRDIAHNQRKKHVELLEDMLELYKKHKL